MPFCQSAGSGNILNFLRRNLKSSTPDEFDVLVALLPEKLAEIIEEAIAPVLVKILEKRQMQARLEHLSWHDFRRTYISDLINQYDLVTAQIYFPPFFFERRLRSNERRWK